MGRKPSPKKASQDRRSATRTPIKVLGIGIGCHAQIKRLNALLEKLPTGTQGTQDLAPGKLRTDVKKLLEELPKYWGCKGFNGRIQELEKEARAMSDPATRIARPALKRPITIFKRKIGCHKQLAELKNLVDRAEGMRDSPQKTDIIGQMSGVARRGPRLLGCKKFQDDIDEVKKSIEELEGADLKSSDKELAGADQKSRGKELAGAVRKSIEELASARSPPPVPTRHRRHT